MTVINLSDLTIVKKGKLNYLGEWHTHPNISPIPSPKDKRCSCSISLTSFNNILLRHQKGANN
ncbi:Mov34/MPN/PAD-1 family protein [Trichococcus collinsii]|uniref:Mov34/MPN/PAD-1 family protein n=1 Tax=Trichococcus collinsii TaxID=157076 RepID=UPI000B35D4F7